MTSDAPADLRPTVRHDPEVTEAQAEHAVERIVQVLRHVGEPVIDAEIRLTVMRGPGVPNPAMAQATVHLKGRNVRAHAAAPTTGEAVELVRDRLAIRLERVARDWESTRGGVRGERHGTAG